MLYLILGIVVLIIIFFLGYKYFQLSSLLEDKNVELQKISDSVEIESQKNQEFISSLSQELRTPLYGIMGLTNLLVDENPSLQNDKNVKSLKFSGDYLLTLINNILQVNALNYEEITTKNSSFNVQEITQHIVNSFSYATANSDNTLVYDYDTDIPDILTSNPAVLSQILMNLISNALRFTKNGNIVFSVNLIKKKNGISTISFKVKHDGNEISKEDEKSIYQEFINIEKVKKTYLGTGFNATIVKKLAKSINGEIILHNDSKIGSEYALLVDLKEPNEQGKTDTETANKKKILVVDDNKLNLLVADKILSKEGFECTTCDNGFDAIKLAEESAYDIILMDINMPKLNGIGTTKRIRKFDSNIPIIALTAVDVTQLNRQIMQAGLNDYILKPYNRNLLIDMIHKYINEQQQS